MKKKIKKPKKIPTTQIENCSFYGVKWDTPSLEVMATVAKGLTNLTELFKSQNVTIETLLKVTNSDHE